MAKGQWEFQIFAKGSAKAADDLWTARYLMMRLCEKYEVDMELHCKPIKGDWNGSGMHTNFSTKYLREVGGKEYFEALMKAFEKYIPEHIAVYGPDNHLRLTGLHETQAIDKFSYGLSDRGASIRMPVNFIKNGYKGYLEDRRPNSEGDPYQIVSRILKTINTRSEALVQPPVSREMGSGSCFAVVEGVGEVESAALLSTSPCRFVVLPAEFRVFLFALLEALADVPAQPNFSGENLDGGKTRKRRESAESNRN